MDEKHIRLECLRLAVQTAMSTADRSTENVEKITTAYYNVVVGSPSAVPGKKDKSGRPDPLS